MSTTPLWAPIPPLTRALLDLVADPRHPSTNFEWATYLRALHQANTNGRVHPNRLRHLIRGHIAPKRIGAFTSTAKARRILTDTGEWETSDDTEGGNSGKPARIYALNVDNLTAAINEVIATRNNTRQRDLADRAHVNMPAPTATPIAHYTIHPNGHITTCNRPQGKQANK